VTILNHLEKIIAIYGERGFKEPFFIEADENLQAISALYKINIIQSALFALIMENEPLEIHKFPSILKCNKIQMYQYMEDLDELQERKLIRKNTRSDSESYYIPHDVIKAVRKGIEYINISNQNLNPAEFFERAEEIFDASEFELSSEEMMMEIKDLVKSNRDLLFVQKTLDHDLKEGSILLLLIFCCAHINHNEKTINLSRLNCLLNRAQTREICKRFKSREHKLLKNGLIEPYNNNGLADTEYYQLTEKTKNEFLSDVDIKKKKNYSGNNFIIPEDIGNKNLFFNPGINERIRELSSLLDQAQFCKIQKNLEDRGMRTGFACLFSGPPGTGKTETVYQIARETGRGIYLVDISETKSMWFGESEKRIKAVFENYKGLVQSNDLAPILLFNEADAVLGKRQELPKGRSGPGQTENAIQNIILQELENLNGILIATTNMTMNLDRAFERRFLYKITFGKPDTESRKKMWQYFMPSLQEHDAAILAKKYDFSGGQIENILRKSTVSEILRGEKPDMERLDLFCLEENIEKTDVKIGFLS